VLSSPLQQGECQIGACHDRASAGRGDRDHPCPTSYVERTLARPDSGKPDQVRCRAREVFREVLTAGAPQPRSLVRVRCPDVEARRIGLVCLLRLADGTLATSRCAALCDQHREARGIPLRLRTLRIVVDEAQRHPEVSRDASSGRWDRSIGRLGGGRRCS